MNRAVILLYTITHLQALNFTVSKLVDFILVKKQLNNTIYPVYRDLLANTKVIDSYKLLPAFIHLTCCTQVSSQDYVCTLLRACCRARSR